MEVAYQDYSTSPTSMNLFYSFSRDTDEGYKTKGIKPFGRQFSFLRYKTRKVNFVIFVVDGVSIIEATESNKKGYIDILRKTFMYPFFINWR